MPKTPNSAPTLTVRRTPPTRYNHFVATMRSILHLDMDAFFASVEQLDNPALRGRPVLVGYDGPRGVVAAASYEARTFGCHSAQPMGIAKRRCPSAIIVPVRGSRYREMSQRMFAILTDFSPLIEPLSIDEAFLDITGTEKLLGPAREVAQRIKQRIADELHLPASVGAAPNKFLAKLASDMDKPNGLTVIGIDDIDRVLPPLPVTRLWGVGPMTAKKLNDAGIKTIGDLRAAGDQQLMRLFGDDAARLLRLAHGIDDRPVVPDGQAKSVSQEHTFGIDVTDAAQVRQVLFEQVEQVARRLRKAGLHCRTVTLKIRFGEFQTITRSSTAESPTSATAELWQIASAIFDRWAATSFQPVRLIGMGASQLDAGECQLPLFADPKQTRARQLDDVADRITRKFGNTAIKRGGGLR